MGFVGRESMGILGGFFEFLLHGKDIRHILMLPWMKSLP